MTDHNIGVDISKSHLDAFRLEDGAAQRFEAKLGETFPLVKVNPLQARRFAEAHGTRAKTDAVDARMLARMGAAFDLVPQVSCSKEIFVLRDLHVARTGLLKDRTRLRNRAKTQDIAVLKRQTKARLAQVERHVVELDAEIAALIAAGQTTARNRDILCSMPGIGTVTAAASPFSSQIHRTSWLSLPAKVFVAEQPA